MTDRTGWTDAELSRLRLEALNHLARLRSGEATERDAAEFVAWRMRSVAHEEVFRSAVRLTRIVRIVEGAETSGPSLPAAANDEGGAPPFSAAARGFSRRALIGGAMAASFAGGALVVGRSVDMVPSLAAIRADYRTGAGERRLVPLAGGASLELNTRTSIGLRHDLGMPGAELLEGEAIVTSGMGGAALAVGKGVSLARGARFNARLDRDEVCVTCLSGAVEVRWSGETRALRANEQVRYDDRRIGEVLRGIDAGVVAAWRAGTLIFQDMPMRAVVHEINRYRAGRVFVASAALADRRLSGTYYVHRLDEFFSQAELGLGANVTRLPGNVIVLS